MTTLPTFFHPRASRAGGDNLIRRRGGSWPQTIAYFLLAVTLLVLTVTFAFEAAVSGFAGYGAWTARLAGVSTLAASYLVLAWGVAPRVHPAPPADKAVALFVAGVGLLTGVGAGAMALALHG